jgi:hypothetical protein
VARIRQQQGLLPFAKHVKRVMVLEYNYLPLMDCNINVQHVTELDSGQTMHNGHIPLKGKSMCNVVTFIDDKLSDNEKLDIVAKFAKDITEGQVDCPPDILAAVNDNLFELM